MLGKMRYAKEFQKIRREKAAYKEKESLHNWLQVIMWNTFITNIFKVIEISD